MDLTAFSGIDYTKMWENIIALWILLPVVWYLLKSQRDDFRTAMENMTKSLNNIWENIRTEWIKTRLAVWDTVLTKEQTINLVKEKMWFVTYQKIEFLKTVLVNNHIKWREPEVKDKIKAELVRMSTQYISEMRDFITPVWDVWEWVVRNFEMEPFLEHIYKIVFRGNNIELTDDINVQLKMNDITVVMKTAQNNLCDELRLDIDKTLNS